MAKATNFNRAIFERWSPSLAYLIGAAITDGNVQSIDRSYGGRTFKDRTVAWQVKDLAWLEMIRAMLGSDRAITTAVRKTGTYYTFRLQGQEAVDGFARYGVLPRKTFDCRVPADLPADLRWHFLRGVIDGDGSIWTRSGGKTNRPGYQRLGASIASGSVEFLRDIQQWAGGLFSTSTAEGHAVSKLSWDCGAACDLLAAVYADSEGMRLERKFDKWRGLVNSGQTYRTAA